MLINELGKLFQYLTPIFVKRNKFLEVIDAFLIHLLQYFLFLISLIYKLIGNLLYKPLCINYIELNLTTS